MSAKAISRSSSSVPALATRRTAKIAEEVASGLDHQHVTLAAEALPIGFLAAVEGEEFRILPECLGVDRRSLGITVTLDLLGFAVGLGDDDLALAIRIGAYLLGFGGTFGAQLVGNRLRSASMRR